MDTTPKQRDRFLAIGDIHGCKAQLLEILEKSKKYPNHTLVFLGDYIDRGPDSDGVLTVLRELDAICLMGNHEEMLIHYLEPLKGREREMLLKNSKISESNYNWIKTLPAIYESSEYIFTHAGLNPNKPLSEQTLRDYTWSYYFGSYHHLTHKIVVQGHMHVKKPYIERNHFIIDTNCGQGGYLTGLLLPEMNFIQSETPSPHFGSL